jgi:pimeloyl-ACP methyl ester carboxylesterase
VGGQTLPSPATAKLGLTGQNDDGPTSKKGNELTEKAAGRYATVNGLKMHYEIHGAGEPLILLHGAVGGIEMLRPILPALSKGRQVIVVDLQGHGHTADIDRPLRYELMADDIAALLLQIGIKKADVAGFSLGAGVALRVAIQHPAVVRRLVVISTPFARKGCYPETLAAMAGLGPEAAKGMKLSPLSKLYPDVNWEVLFKKLADLVTKDYDWSKEVAAIKAPTMLVFADADVVRPAHIVEFFGLFGGGQKDPGMDGSGRPVAQLAILPGLSHIDIIDSPVLAAVLTAFLDSPLPKSK